MKARTGRQTASRHFGLLLLAAAVWALGAAASARAEIVTVGSPLTVPFTGYVVSGTGTLTLANTALSEPGANVFSPVTGVIVRWRVSGAFIGGPFKLRVLRPAGGGTYKGAGTSAGQTPSGTATQVFPTNLPIQAGDLIGLDDTNQSDQFGAAGVPGSTFSYWSPALADPDKTAPMGSTTNFEVGFNADVAAKPSSSFSFGKVKRNKDRGTATLAVNVPGPGTLSLTGKGVKTQRTSDADGAVASKTVTAAGRVKLRIKAKGAKKQKLNERGKAKVKVTVTYTPAGDLVGDPNTKSKRVRLIKRG